jgi:hypothetical protein
MIRRGVSLLEVLFSIGVIGIGLLGVIALYPLALGQIGTGMVADRSARAGQNAVEVFAARGMARPDQLLWFRYSTTNPATAEPVDASTTDLLLRDGPNSGFLIDPMFVAVQRQTNNANYDARLFPYYPRQAIPNPITPSSPYPSNFDPRLRRVTLRSLPGATSIMNAAQAELLFRSNDDLSFELPLDRNAPPDQIFGKNNARRQYEGTISWMATLVPQLNITNSGTSPGELYQLSIIVFDRRDSSMAMDIQNERVVNVAAFHNAGLGGGDVTLGASTTAELEVTPGQWLMLMATPHEMITSTTPTTPGVSLFRWYRVIDTEDEPHPGSSVFSWERDVVLQGADWPSSMPAGIPAYLDDVDPSSAVAPRPTRVALVSNVVAVYERTIRLERSGLWTY